MKQRMALVSGILLLAMVLAGSGTAYAQVSSGGGLLLNGSFDGQYAALGGNEQVLIAPSWLPWWTARNPGDVPWLNQRPQFHRSDERAHGGSVSQRVETNFGTYQAGILQRVSTVERGDVLSFEIWAMTWSSNHDHECCSLESGLIEVRVGIDPTGGVNPYANSVVWSAPVQTDDEWAQISVSSLAYGETVTVFVLAQPKYAVKHNEVFLDDARLVVTGHEVIPAVDIAEPSKLQDPFAVSDPFPPGDDIVSGPLVYSIQPGDTLGSIAKLFEVDVNELADSNGLTVDSTIFAAGQLVIPGRTFTAPSRVASYTLKEGDSLTNLAAAFDTTVYYLAQLNDIALYSDVGVGDEVLVPVAFGAVDSGGGSESPVEEGPDVTVTPEGSTDGDS